MNADLDRVINEREILMRMTQTADVGEDTELSLTRIYTDIASEAKRLPATARPWCRLRQRRRSLRTLAHRIYRKLRSLDAGLCRRSRLYTRLRSYLKRILLHKNTPKVSAKSLLKYDGEEFIDACYRKLLLRAPDEEALTNAKCALDTQKISKIDLIRSICYSEEFKGNTIQVIGL